jgi:hypothetical protein
MSANPENEKGYFESVPLMHLHDKVLASAGTRWDDWRLFHPEWYQTASADALRERATAVLKSEFFDSAAFILKDPRVCRFAPFWLSIFQEQNITPRIIVPFRSPLEVALSLRKRNDFSINHGLLLWLRHVLDAEAFSRPHKRAFVHWADLNKDWRASMAQAASTLGRPWPRVSDQTSAAIDGFLSDGLWHNQVADPEMRSHSEINEWIAAVYDSLCELSREPSSNSARVALDEIRKQFDQAAQLFGRNLVTLEIANSDLKNSLATATSREADTSRELNDQLELAQLLEARDKETISQLETARESVAGLTAQLARNADELTAATTERNEMILKLEEAQRSLIDERAMQAEVTAERDEARRQLDDVQAAMLVKQDDLASAASELASLKATRDELQLRAEDLERSEVEWKRKHGDVSLELQTARNAVESTEAKILDKDAEIDWIATELGLITAAREESGLCFEEHKHLASEWHKHTRATSQLLLVNERIKAIESETLAKDMELTRAKAKNLAIESELTRLKLQCESLEKTVVEPRAKHATVLRELNPSFASRIKVRFSRIFRSQ